ncbi:GSCOCG00005958001-RA-CDS [Cotesia congregata]|nr:GSCOCG00005958001-RA-CDS [Cotesia congregata]
MPGINNLKELIRQTFDETQAKKTCHKKHVERLTKILNNHDLEEFTKTFIKFVQLATCAGETNPHAENFLDFTVKFSMSLPPHENLDESQTEDEDDDSVSLSTFALKIFNYCQEKHEAQDKTVRMRICQLINKMLRSMPDNAIVDDLLFESLQKVLISRSIDKAPKVRAQAMAALGRLQEPDNPDCKVKQLYFCHLRSDPCAEVRKIIIENLSANRDSIKEVSYRINDVQESVRKAAYLFISKIRIDTFTIKQRVRFFKEGLNDPSKKIQDVVRNKLLKTWCEYFDNEYLRFLTALDPQTFQKTSVQVLNLIFEQSERDKLIQQLPLELESKLIPVNALTSENVLYWRCLIEYLCKESCEEKLEECRPELTHFCQYIHEYQAMMASKSFTPLEVATQEFILSQLYNIAKSYDLSDEVGRRNLDKLICETLQSEKCSVAITELITLYYEKVEQDVDRRLENLAHIISEIRMPTTKSSVEVEEITDSQQHERKMLQAKKQINLRLLEEQLYCKTEERDFIGAQKLKEKIDELTEEIKHLAESVNPVAVMEVENYEEKNDPETMLRCLTIACCMAQVTSVRTLNSVLRSLYDNLVFPSLTHQNRNVHILTLKAVGIFSMLDEKLAKERFWHYLMYFTEEENSTDLWIISLKVVFDLLLRYGLETFNISNEVDSTVNITGNNTQRSRKSGSSHRLYSNTSASLIAESLVSDISENSEKNLITIMTALCDNSDESIRTIATEGLSKLLLHQRLSSVNLVVRFLIMLFNPANEGSTELNGTLKTFFKYYPTVVPNSQEVLERAFMPTLRMICRAPNGSPLMAIELENVAAFILQLTDCTLVKSRSDYTVHNNLAVVILAAALNDDEEIDRSVLLKCLKYLNVDLTSDQMKEDLISTINDIAVNLQPHERNLRICISQFKKKIEGVPEQEVDKQDGAEGEGETEGTEDEQDQEQEQDHLDIQDD